ncbi:SDR family NAD(P)-dependent oxidoreductase [Robiginitalea marina]|uniref:SDR family NAD(P)-dependent oxidoreductase n=1 Tax=Robiginitalea marina TaxID=2954105 RepID=A0ABT1AZX3_9FLAO|nr:SDR family NAD(P)-dependent oxidoreductase [Robiginitalea marina]MCO5725598.1 SDR family NAD(P)-dependent oxidoreductase [Robiginitalea marina]
METHSFFDLKNKTAIVTGGGNGIGRGACETLAAFGANVVVSDLKLEDAEQVASEIKTRGGKAIAVSCNVMKDEDLQNVVNAALDAFGSIEILVNNAGGVGWR